MISNSSWTTDNFLFYFLFFYSLFYSISLLLDNEEKFSETVFDDILETSLSLSILIKDKILLPKRLALILFK